jgi:broad specificity phosphatase PhoE
MSTLALVRHGQASFFSDNYDQLSAVGEQQARLLGEYWLKRGARFDQVYSGPRVRQLETAVIAGQVFAEAGLPWPEAVVAPELDEHQVDRLIKLAMPRIAGEFPDIGRLHEDYVAAEGPLAKHRSFQLMFEKVVMLWVAGRVAAPEVESWAEFSKRVSAGLRRIVESAGRGQSIAAFTSVGAITVALQLCLQCPDRTAFDLGWRVRNASITEFLFSRDRLTMESFNSLAHLDDPALVTYR